MPMDDVLDDLLTENVGIGTTSMETVGMTAGSASARIEVWAPNAERVRVVAFGPDGEERLDELDRRDGYWEAAVELTVGQEYLLELDVGGQTLRRLDPRSRAVTNSVGRSIWTDPSTFDRGDFVAAPVHEWVIYELHPRTFGGDLAGVAQRLDHLVELGVNVIELMPVSEFAGDVSWGYNPALPFAIESSYGGPDGLRHLVRECHSRGIAVLIDVVYNHLGPSDLDLWQFDAWSEGDGGGIYFYNDDRAQTPWGATRPDYGRDEVRQYLIDSARMWFAEYGADGLRLDSTVNIRNIDGGVDPGRALPDGERFLRDLNTSIHAEFPWAITVAEDLQRDPLVTAPVDQGGLGFDLQWAADFVHPVRSALIALDDGDRDVDAVTAAIVGGADRVIYTESHDEVANGSTRVPSEIDPESPDAGHAFRRSVLGAALMVASPGVPMLFQGQEWGDEDWFDDTRPLDWDRREERSGTFDAWRDLIHLRRSDQRTGGLRGDQVDVAQPVPGVLAISRWGLGGPTSRTIVVVNLFAVDHAHVDLGLEPDAGWEVVFASDWTGYHGAGTDHVGGIADGGCPIPAYGCVVIAAAVS